MESNLIQESMTKILGSSDFENGELVSPISFESPLNLLLKQIYLCAFLTLGCLPSPLVKLEWTFRIKNEKRMKSLIRFISHVDG
jgi:hypothetical protein